MDWKTAITESKDNEVRVRGYLLQDLMGKLAYSQMVALLIKGELPSSEEHIVLDALLVAASERGAQSSAALVTRQAAAAGAPLHSAVCSALMSLSSAAGMDIEECMAKIMETMDLVSEKGMGLEEAAVQVVEATLDGGRSMPGFGIPPGEPEAVPATLLGLVEGLDLPLAGATKVVRALEIALAARLDEHLPVNLSGAMATALCELDYPAEVGNAFFLLGRTPGLVAHFLEEKLREKPGRLMNASSVGFDGREARELI